MTPQALAALHGQVMTTPAPYSAADFTALLAAPGVFLQGDAQGFALGRVTLDEAELLTLAVAPDRQRRGLGRHWLRAFQHQAATRGATRAFLEVAVPNTAARALYAAEGWAEVGRRPRYYVAPQGPRQDALVLARALAR